MFLLASHSQSVARVDLLLTIKFHESGTKSKVKPMGRVITLSCKQLILCKLKTFTNMFFVEKIIKKRIYPTTGTQLQLLICK